MRVDLCLVGVTALACLAGAACSSSASKPGNASAGSAALAPVGGSSNGGASGSGQAGVAPTAGSSGSTHDGGSANAGGAGSANAGGGGSANGGDAGSANAGGAFQPGTGGLASNLEPDVCSSVAYEEDGPSSTTQRANCQVCCNQAQLDSFGSYQGKCMCATSVPADTTVCAQSSAEVCPTCCNNAGFAVGTGTSKGCYCFGTSTLCASAAGDANLCRLCCTEHGYLAWGSDKQCTCTS